MSVFTGQSQCIFNKQSPNSTVVSNNSGTLQYISDFAVCYLIFKPETYFTQTSNGLSLYILALSVS